MNLTRTLHESEFSASELSLPDLSGGGKTYKTGELSTASILIVEIRFTLNFTLGREPIQVEQ
jgi:hypothetical protein